MRALSFGFVVLAIACSSTACNGARKAQEQQATADVSAITKQLGPELDAMQKAVAAEAPKVGATVLPARADAKASETALFTVIHGNAALTPRTLGSTPCVIGEDGRLFLSWPSKTPLQDQAVYQLFPQIAGAKDAPVVAFVHWPELQSGGYDGDGIIYAAPAKPGAFMMLLEPHELASRLMRETIHAPDPSEREVDVALFDGEQTYWATVSPFAEKKDQPSFETATSKGPATGSVQPADIEFAWAAARIPELGPHAGVVVARQVK